MPLGNFIWVNRVAGVRRLFRSGRIVALNGLRMMPLFPRSPLSFRKASFPRYGSKAGLISFVGPAKEAAATEAMAEAVQQVRHDGMFSKVYTGPDPDAVLNLDDELVQVFMLFMPTDGTSHSWGRRCGSHLDLNAPPAVTGA